MHPRISHVFFSRSAFLHLQRLWPHQHGVAWLVSVYDSSCGHFVTRRAALFQWSVLIPNPLLLTIH